MAVAAPAEKLQIPENMKLEEKTLFTALATEASSLGEAEDKEVSEIQGWETMKKLKDDWEEASKRAEALIKTLPTGMREPYGEAFTKLSKIAMEMPTEAIDGELERLRAEEKEENKKFGIEIGWGTVTTEELEDAAFLAEKIMDVMSEHVKGTGSEDTTYAQVLTRGNFPNSVLRTFSSKTPTILTPGNNCVIVGGRLEALTINDKKPADIKAAGDVPLIQPGDQIGFHVFASGDREPKGRILINIDPEKK